MLWRRPLTALAILWLFLAGLALSGSALGGKRNCHPAWKCVTTTTATTTTQPPPPPPPPVGCTDTLGSGSVSSFVAGLAPGAVGCLEGSFSENVTIRNGGITLTSAPGQVAHLTGRLWITDTANDVTIAGLYLDGKNGSGLPSPTVNGDRAHFVDDEVTNEHTAICFDLGSVLGYGVADAPLLERNRIHDCGKLPAQNHDHGIYVESTRNAVIRDNYLYENADRGIQLYPDAQGSLVEHNVIDGNGEGVLFGGDVSPPPICPCSSNENVVTGNIISDSTLRWLVESWWPGSVGTGNVVSGNCLWPTNPNTYYDQDGGVSIEAPLGFSATTNLVADPLYLDPTAGDFRLAPGSPCAGYGPQT